MIENLFPSCKYCSEECKLYQTRIRIITVNCNSEALTSPTSQTTEVNCSNLVFLLILLASQRWIAWSWSCFSCSLHHKIQLFYHSLTSLNAYTAQFTFFIVGSTFHLSHHRGQLSYQRLASATSHATKVNSSIRVSPYLTCHATDVSSAINVLLQRSIVSSQSHCASWSYLLLHRQWSQIIQKQPLWHSGAAPLQH